MSRNHLTLAGIVASFVCAACSGPAQTPQEAGRVGPPAAQPIAFAPCTLSGASASSNVEAHCGTLSVPENPAQPQGRRIDLRIARLDADNPGAAADPVFFIAGGPGQAATDVALPVSTALRQARRKRDIYLIDQRGTGGSNPLTCLGPDGKDLPLDENAAPNEATIRDYASACATSLEGRADPRFYATSQAIDDLDAVRKAIGVPRVNLVGASYGTRVAQRYAARYPQHVRTIVLDGVAPNDLVVGGDFANTFEDAIVLQAAQCIKDAACAKRFPVNTRTQLRTVMDALSAAPVSVEYRDPGTAQLRRDVLTADSVIGLAFAFSYMPELSSLLPVVLDEAAQGRYAPLAALARNANRSLGLQLNRGMQWSVICSEDADRYQPSAGGDRLVGAHVADMFFAACPVWPHEKAAADSTTPLTSDAPVLLLSGELDPVTPPRYAEQVLKGLPNGRHIVARGQGHGTLNAGCMPRLLGQFIDNADAKALDVSCLDTLSHVPAFTSFNGWEP